MKVFGVHLIHHLFEVGCSGVPRAEVDNLVVVVGIMFNHSIVQQAVQISYVTQASVL